MKRKSENIGFRINMNITQIMKLISIRISRPENLNIGRNTSLRHDMRINRLYGIWQIRKHIE